MTKTYSRWMVWVVGVSLWGGNLFAGTVLVYENGDSFTTSENGGSFTITSGALEYFDGTTDLKVSGSTLLSPSNSAAFVGVSIPITLDNFNAVGLRTGDGLVGEDVTGSVYFSFLMRSVGTDNVRTSGLILFDSERTVNNGNQTYIGRVGSDTLRFNGNRPIGAMGYDIGKGNVFGTDTTHLIVGKIDFTEGSYNAVLSMWCDPDLTAGMLGQPANKSTLNITGTEAATLSTQLKLSFDELRFIAPASNTGKVNTIHYDEIRMGTTWESVLPTRYVAWDGLAGTNDWDTAGNWNRGTTPENGDVVTLGGTQVTKDSSLALTNGGLRFEAAAKGFGSLTIDGAADLTGTTVSVATDFVSQYVPTSQTLLTSTSLTGFTASESTFWKIAANGGKVVATMNDDYHKMGTQTVKQGSTVELAFEATATGWVELRDVTVATESTLMFVGDEANWEAFAAVLETAYEEMVVDTSEPLLLKLSGFESVASSAILWDLTAYNALYGTNFREPLHKSLILSGRVP
ncbi:MAG: hypothetical protein Q4D98_06805 [Planctomycetia bacterium]|nr:hypothetical protein [Planctomycetia bacterium]